MSIELFLSNSDSTAMYQQIMDQITAKVIAGDWPAGTELPSIRQLAVELRVSVITVKRAYLELEREGVIVTRHGVGSTVAPTAGLPDRLLEAQLVEELDRAARTAAALGLTPADLIDRLTDALRRAAPEAS